MSADGWGVFVCSFVELVFWIVLCLVTFVVDEFIYNVTCVCVMCLVFVVELFVSFFKDR